MLFAILLIRMYTLTSIVIGLRSSFKNLRRTQKLSSLLMTSIDHIEQLGLTPTLEKYCKSLNAVTDDKLRYQQLLFLASKCKPMPSELKIPENKGIIVLIII